MEDLYKKLKKENNQSLKSFTGEYKINLEEYIKIIRDYSAKLLSTENEIKKMISEFKENYQNNVRFTTFISNKQSYLEEIKSRCVKGNKKPKFSIKQKIGIGIFIFLMVGLTIFGILLERPVHFDIPENISINETILTFDKVKDAKKYQINITDINDSFIYERSINTTSFDLATVSEITKEGTYKIRIKTLSNGAFKDSKWSNAVIYVYTN